MVVHTNKSIILVSTSVIAKTFKLFNSDQANIIVHNGTHLKYINVQIVNLSMVFIKFKLKDIL